VDEQGYTFEAEALFKRFAEKHALTYEVETDIPMEVCWKFPVQPKLSLPLTLGLQNADELNFGVWDFWSYFFPFERVEEEFERILDAWIAGEARVAVLRGRGRLLQLREGEKWETVYWADGFLSLFRRFPRALVRNGDTERDLEERGLILHSGTTPPWGCMGLMYATFAFTFAATSGRWAILLLWLLLALVLFPLFAVGAKRVQRIDYSNR